MERLVGNEIIPARNCERQFLHAGGGSFRRRNISSPPELCKTGELFNKSVQKFVEKRP
jgi:hypothetical protein